MSTLAVRAILGLSVPPRTLVLDAAQAASQGVLVRRAADCPFHAPLGPAEPLHLGPDPTVAALRSALGPSLRALGWSAVTCRLECPRGDFASDVWGSPRSARCPNCASFLRPRTTLELTMAPGETKLSELGVAPREILVTMARDGGMGLVEVM